MTRVYGTGIYDFKRHRVAEYPVEPPLPPSEDERPTVDSKPASATPTLPNNITLSEIQRDHLTKIASANWLASSYETKSPFDADLVRDIYETELKGMGGRKTVSLQRVMILEVSQYLENYLWPNFEADTATLEHVMSMILMVNEKFRENVAAWTCFYDRKDDFRGFLERVLRLKEGRELDISEKTNYLVFMINAFQSLEDEVVSEIVLRLASLESWHSLSYGRFQMELCLNPDLIKKWKRMIKRESKDALKNGGVFNPTTKPEVKFLRNLMGEFLEVLNFKIFPDRHDFDDHFDAYDLGKVDDTGVLYCERFVEFLIDLLSHLPTRRYLRPLVADVAVVAKCHLSALYKHRQGKLFAQLVDLLQFYEGFEINDHVGTQLKDDELRDLALVNVGSVHKRADLSKKLSVLTPEELRDLVCNKMERNFAEEIYSESLRSSSRIDSNRDLAARSEPDDVDVVWEDEESWNESERLDGEGRARRLQLYNIGYRDGVIAGNEASAQEGFNAGIKQSVGSGYNWGVVRGVVSALHCLPDAFRAKLAGSDESRVKFASLHESVHSLSTSDALKLYADEIVGGKTTQPGSSSAEIHSALDGLSVTSSQSTVLTKYFAELKSLLVQSPGIAVHVEKSL